MGKDLKEKAMKEAALYRHRAFLNPERYSTFGSNILNAFVAGAVWQNGQTIDKACEKINEIMFKDGSASAKIIIDKFRKAMEAEE